MTFERSTDYRLIREVMTHPKVYPNIGDDGAPDVTAFRVNEDARIWYVTIREQGQLLGLFLFLPLNAIAFEMHVCLLPKSRGYSAAAGKGVLAWMFEHSPARRIVGSTYLPHAARIAVHGWGMEVLGRNEASFLKGGVLRDQLILGVSP